MADKKENMGKYHKYTVIAAYDINSCGHLDFDREAYEYTMRGSRLPHHCWAAG